MALDPDVQSARDFLVHASRGTLLSHYMIAELARIAKLRDIDESDRADQMDALLQRLSYSTTLDRAAAEFDAMVREERRYWAGRYAVVDDTGAEYYLDIGDDDAVLYALGAEAADDKPKDDKDDKDDSGLPHTTTHGLVDGVLSLGGDLLSAKVTFVLPLTREQENKDDLDVAAALARGEARLRGSITRRGATRTVRGKRGCFTRAGIDRELDGDPPSTWAGVYQLLYTDDPAVPVAPVRLALIATGDTVDVELDGKPLAGARWIGNRLIGGDTPNRVGGEFVMAPGEQRRFYGALEIDGAVRPVHGTRAGDARAPGPPDAPPVNPPADRPPIKRPTDKPANPRIVSAKQAVHAALAVNPNFSNAPRRIPLDLTNLTTTGKLTYLRTEPVLDPTGKPKVDDKGQPVTQDVTATVYAVADELTLPLAVERNAYVIDFSVKNLAATHPMFTGATDKTLDAERVEIDDDGYTKAFTKLRAVELEDPVTKANIRGFRYEVVGGETESAHWYNSYLAIWPRSKPDQRVHVFMSMGVGSRIPIAITADVPTIFISKAFSGSLTGTGGEPPLSWKYEAADTDTIVNDTGPIKFDATKQTFTGTLSDLGLAGRSYSVKVTAAADERVVMQPCAINVSLRVDLLGTAIDASAIGVGVVGSLFGAGASLALGIQWLMKRSKADAKREKAITAVHDAVADKAMTRAEMQKAVYDAYVSGGTKMKASLDAARDAIKSLSDNLASKHQAADVAKERVRRALLNDSLSVEEKIALEKERESIDSYLEELRERERNVDRLDRDVDHAERKNSSDADFKKHIER